MNFGLKLLIVGVLFQTFAQLQLQRCTPRTPLAVTRVWSAIFLVAFLTVITGAGIWLCTK